MDDSPVRPSDEDLTLLVLRHLDRQTTREEDVLLATLLRDDPASRLVYVSVCHQDSLLRELTRPAKHASTHKRSPSLSLWKMAATAIAAGVILAVTWWSIRQAIPTDELVVATITGVEGCRWADPAPEPGVGLPAGTRLELMAGQAEITCSRGARLVLRGPVELVLDTSSHVTLRHGAVCANVQDPGESGFVLGIPGGLVVDRGTSFGVEVDGYGTSRVATFQGLVDVVGSQGGEAIRVAPGSELKLSAVGRVSEIVNINNSGGFIRELQAPAIGLVAHWPLRDHQFTDVVEPFGTSNLSGGLVNWDDATGADTALHLNGRQSLTITHTRKLDLAGDLTIAAWIRSTAPIGDLVSKYDWIGRKRSYTFGIGGERDPDHSRPGHLYAWISSKSENFDGATIRSSKPVADGHWHHVAMVFTAGQSLSLYIDGKIDSSAELTGNIPKAIAISPRQLAIGAGYNDSEFPNDFFFTGNLADVRIYRMALADIAVLAASMPPAGATPIAPAQEPARSLP